MTTTPDDLERKVRQLDNDVQSIYEMLTGIEGTLRRHSNRFLEMSAQLTVVNTKLGGLDTKVDGLDTNVGALDTKVDGLDTKLGGLHTKLGGLDTKVDEILRLIGNGSR